MVLASEKCVPCKKGEGKLTVAEVDALFVELKGWLLEDVTITKRLKFSNFAFALEFVNRVGKVAEEQNHHPDLKLGWGYVDVAFTTHNAGGLTRNDFILAAKIDEIS